LFGSGAPGGASSESEQCYRVAEARVGKAAARWH